MENAMRTMRVLMMAAAIAGLPALPPAFAQGPEPPAPKPGMMGGMMHGQGMPGGMMHPPGVSGQAMPMAEGQGMPMMQGMQAMPGMAAGPDDPVAAAFEAINRRMHREMAVTPGGSADSDFVMGMIAHHRGAIDMAKVVLGFGTDPEIRKLAEGIIAAQTAEIAQMEAWLAKQPQ
jgi:hypothetical protein